MRIAMMTNNYKPVVGGVSISIERLAGALRARGHAVTIFAPHFAAAAPEEGVVRYRSSDRGLPGGVVLPNPLDPAIERAFCAGAFDLIHTHHPMLIGYAARRLARKYGVPLAFTYHTRYEQYLHYWKPYDWMRGRGGENGAARAACTAAEKLLAAHNRAFISRCDLVFAPSPRLRDDLRQSGVGRPVAVLPTGLAEGDFAWDVPFSEELRARHLGAKQYLFCSVSRLEKEKNLPFLLQAAARFRQRCGDCFRLLLVGDGSQRLPLEREALRLGLADNIRFAGSVPHAQLGSYYRACDLFVFASRSETQGIVLLEGMAAGLPVVAVDAGGVCDVVEDGSNGWKTGDDAGLFAARMAMAVENPALWQRMSRAAAATAAGCTAAQMAQEAERCYEELLRGRRLEQAVRERGARRDPTWRRAARLER